MNHVLKKEPEPMTATPKFRAGDAVCFNGRTVIRMRNRGRDRDNTMDRIFTVQLRRWAYCTNLYSPKDSNATLADTGPKYTRDARGHYLLRRLDPDFGEICLFAHEDELSLV